MNKKLDYVATNMTMLFWANEMITGAKLKQQKTPDKEIRRLAQEENIFQARSENFRKKAASGIISRLNTLDEFTIDLLCSCNIETAKQITIYSILKSDLLFFDFVNEIYREKIILKDYKITDVDINIFINRKQEQVPKIASWKETTIRKLKNNYISYLSEAGFVKKQKDYLEIIKPIIDKKFAEHLIEIGDQIYLEAMTAYI